MHSDNVSATNLNKNPAQLSRAKYIDQDNTSLSITFKRERSHWNLLGNTNLQIYLPNPQMKIAFAQLGDNYE